MPLHRVRFYGFAAVTFALFSVSVFAQSLPQHHLHIVLHPEQHSLEAEDRIVLPPNTPRKLPFTMSRKMNPTSPDATIQIVKWRPENLIRKYRVTVPQGGDSFTMTYGGEIFQPPRQDARETRSFESTPGIIGPEGIVLTGDSGWYPNFGESMVTFSLDIDLPPGWRAISQGKRSEDSVAVKGRQGHVHWEEKQPQDQIYLIAAPFTEYARNESGYESLVYLRSDDAALANRYQDATARYIAMYQKLIGPYPYAKFALVENFWETGYGMPSFTLLGSQVIRLPFIIDTSYPHEILHNWWGNGVYVDYSGGNWSEGLTAYLADHLLQEQKGNGAEYRRSILQKYADFVSSGRDFPLTQFTSRHSAQTEAVGYGKAMMMFHMLRRKLGDDIFIRALQNFYRDYRFKRAGFADLQHEFSKSSGIDLRPFFAQWVKRTGAPQLRLLSAQVNSDQVNSDQVNSDQVHSDQVHSDKTRRAETGYELVFEIEQIQPGPAYHIDLPFAVTLAGQDDAYSTVVEMKDKRVEIRLTLATQPLRVDVDPEFDLFRRLDRDEIPPALSQVFGAEKLLIVLPRKAPEDRREEFESIAQTWKMQPSRVTRIVWDDEIGDLPVDGSVWLFGEENRFRGKFQQSLVESGEMMSEGGVWLAREYDRARDALVLTTHIGPVSVAWLSAPDAGVLPVLARKLPHYSKFSYAAFSGPESTNLIKGIWPVTSSPLGMAVKQQDGSTVDVPRGKLAVRESLVHQ
jgi:Peptidase family M1 domain